MPPHPRPIVDGELGKHVQTSMERKNADLILMAAKDEETTRERWLRDRIMEMVEREESMTPKQRTMYDRSRDTVFVQLQFAAGEHERAKNSARRMGISLSEFARRAGSVGITPISKAEYEKELQHEYRERYLLE